MTVLFDDGQVRVLHGDCLVVMAEMEPESVDAIVCDPPYGLEFMGKEWDRPWAVSADAAVGYKGREDNLTLPSHRDGRNANCRRCGGRARGAKRCTCAEPQWDRAPVQDMRDFQDWCEVWAKEALRVIKPGGYLLAFGGTRTYHRMACGVEDAGFEIRDSINWIYGSGFPKSLSVSKAIDKASGVEREVGTQRTNVGMQGGNFAGGGKSGHVDVTVATSAEAQKWDGWETALKPAHELIVVARKPLIGAVIENVLTHGTGAINIDATRISSDYSGPREGENSAERRYTEEGTTDFAAMPGPRGGGPKGRWPTNVVFSHAPQCQEVGTKRVKRSGGDVSGQEPSHTGETGIYGEYERQPFKSHADADGKEAVADWHCVEGCPIAELDRQSGVLKSGGEGADGHIRNPDQTRNAFAAFAGQAVEPGRLYGDEGGASRFFPTFAGDPGFRYVAKASSSERNAGLYELPERPGGVLEGNADTDGARKIGARPDEPVSPTRNFHPTVKPVELMRWLIRLVTPPGGTMLDPFLGSGTTLLAAIAEQVKGIGIEKDPDYAELARERVTNATVQLSMF